MYSMILFVCYVFCWWCLYLVLARYPRLRRCHFFDRVVWCYLDCWSEYGVDDTGLVCIVICSALFKSG